MHATSRAWTLKAPIRPYKYENHDSYILNAKSLRLDGVDATHSPYTSAPRQLSLSNFTTHLSTILTLTFHTKLTLHNIIFI